MSTPAILRIGLLYFLIVLLSGFTNPATVQSQPKQNSAHDFALQSSLPLVMNTRILQGNSSSYVVSAPGRSRGLMAQQFTRSGQGTQVSIIAPGIGGLVGAAAGFVGGGLIGAALARNDRGDGWAELGGFLMGAVIGEVSLTPVGVHIGNKRQGSLALDFLTSAVTGIGGLIMASQLSYAQSLLVLVPVVQISATVAVERMRGR